MIGLTGGIASGKSTVAGILEELGARVIDSDALTHEALRDPEVIRTFRGWWGERVCTADGCIDRAAMAEIIFENQAERSRMERFLYPLLKRRREALMGESDRDPAVRAIVINSPLLHEFGLDKICDLLVHVDCERASRQRRALATRGWTEEEFARREKLQKPLDMKRAAADYRVINDSSVEALRSQVKPLFERLLLEPPSEPHGAC